MRLVKALYIYNTKYGRAIELEIIYNYYSVKKIKKKKKEEEEKLSGMGQ
jgi:hypothetical protein